MILFVLNTDPLVIILNDVQLPPVAVVNFQLPSTVTVMCTGTERFTMASSVSTLPNPVVPGFYSESDGGVRFSVTAFNNLLVLTVNYINGELPNPAVSINCTSLESSAVTKIFFTNGEWFVIALKLGQVNLDILVKWVIFSLGHLGHIIGDWIIQLIF